MVHGGAFLNFEQSTIGTAVGAAETAAGWETGAAGAAGATAGAAGAGAGAAGVVATHAERASMAAIAKRPMMVALSAVLSFTGNPPLPVPELGRKTE